MSIPRGYRLHPPRQLREVALNSRRCPGDLESAAVPRLDDERRFVLQHPRELARLDRRRVDAAPAVASRGDPREHHARPHASRVDHRPQDDALAEEAVPESADGSEAGRQTFRSAEAAHLARQRGQALAGPGPPTAPGWARERPRLENRRGQELLEAVAVAEREVAARGSAVAAEARALVEHQVGPARGRENRPRGLPAVGMAEELIPAWEHHGDTLALGEAQALVGRPLGPAVADRRLHAGP